MKTKSLSLVVIALFLVGSFTALGVGKQAAAVANEQTFNLQFAEPKTSDTNILSTVYSQINLGGVDQTYYVAGKPVLPMSIKTLEFPLGTDIISVDMTPQGIQTMTVPNKIQFAPQPVTLDQVNPVAQYIADESIYGSTQYFPDNWFDYSTGGGLNSNMQHTTFLNIRTFPVRYSPATNTIQYIQSAVVTVNYKTPEKQMIFNQTYQLVIIAPKAWASDLKKLVDDKKAKGITTKLMTLEEIYTNYTKGYDEPENIKLFIYDAVKNWGAQDVLLVGGYKGYLQGRGGRDTISKGVTNWYLPVRYTDLDEGGSEHDPGYISDLYYADVMTANGSFSSWDSNHDHVYAKWAGISGKDILDLYPDVAVGRIAARTTKELNIMVNKIITYEASPPASSWFKTMVLVGGDSFDDRPYGMNIPEGEYSTSFTYNESMRAAGFTATKLYSSNHNKSLDTLTPTPKNIIREVSKGCGFLYFDGHGNPLSWNTHWLDQFNWGKGTPGGLNDYEMIALRNKNKLPVCIVGGCHNSMLNISLLWSLNSKAVFTWVYGQPTPRSWSEWMVAKNKGGAIACIGNTGLGYGMIGMVNGTPACILDLGGYVERMFFKAYNESTIKTFGSSWTGAITKYLQTWPGMAQQADCKTVEEWLPLGDPSLVIG